MLNKIWAAMITVGIVYAAFTGRMAEVAGGALDAAGEAVELCIAMIGVMALWVGLMEIASSSGLIASLTRGIGPFVSFLFPRIPIHHPAREYIAANIIANVLGLGWAATPAGLKAMESLSDLEIQREGQKNEQQKEQQKKEQRERAASNEMCTFLILNISSLQLIPVSVIAYRAQYGSANPAAVVGPAIAATLMSTLVGVVFARLMDRRQPGKTG